VCRHQQDTSFVTTTVMQPTPNIYSTYKAGLISNKVSKLAFLVSFIMLSAWGFTIDGRGKCMRAAYCGTCRYLQENQANRKPAESLLLTIVQYVQCKA
jgi:hypothetical protein